MKFQVGDKVEFVMNYGSFRKGDVVKVTGIWPNEKGVEFEGKGKTGNCYNERITMVKPTKNQRITALESVVKDLEQKIIDIRNDYRYDLKQAETRIKMLEFKLEEQTKLIPPSIQSVEEIIEFEGNRYRKVDREAREGDVIIIRNQHPKTDAFELNKPYKVLSDTKIISDNPKHIHGPYPVYGEIVERTTETVDVYELIKQEKPLIVDEVAEYFATQRKSANQQRAEIIEKAKKFVEVKSECVKDSPYVKGGIARKKIENPNFYNYAAVKVEFIINQEKRTVVSLVKFNDGSIMTKDIAKCNPSDVFNEHIGKAIALGRALGLDVSEFEQAVQPTLAIGQEVQNIWSQNVTRITETFETSDTNSLGYIQSQGSDYKIINDTNAQYEGVK